MEVITKAELVAKVARELCMDKTNVVRILECFTDNIMDVVSEGNDVVIRGFGRFTRKHRAEKHARNIKAGTSIVVPAHDIPSFKPSIEFSNRVKS